jgi:hypothetical protein
MTVYIFKCSFCRNKNSKRFKSAAKVAATDCTFCVKIFEDVDSGITKITYINPYHTGHNFDPTVEHMKLKAANRFIPDVVKHKLQMMHAARGIGVPMMERIIQQVLPHTFCYLTLCTLFICKLSRNFLSSLDTGTILSPLG